MKKKLRKKIKIIYKESSLPKEEKERRLFEALKLLISKEDLLDYFKSEKKESKRS